MILVLMCEPLLNPLLKRLGSVPSVQCCEPNFQVFNDSVDTGFVLF